MVTYKDLRLEAGLRLDLLVEESVIVELKSVQRIEPVFEAQLLSYLKLTGFRAGLPRYPPSQYACPSMVTA